MSEAVAKITAPVKEVPVTLLTAIYELFTNAKPSKIVIWTVFVCILAFLAILLVYYLVQSTIKSAGKLPVTSLENIADVTSQRIAKLSGAVPKGAASSSVNYDAATARANAGYAKASSLAQKAQEKYNPLEGFEGFEQGAKEGFEGFQNLDGQKSLYNDLINRLAPSERFLANLCPLTASIGGYIGPLQDGVFNSPFYLQKALRAGIRAFILPISTYTDDNKKPPLWPYSGEPAIVCRNSEGTIVSLNGLTIRKFCSDLLIAKSENAPQSDEPIILYLQQVPGFVPDPVKSEANYVKFMGKIAKELEPINRFRITSLGPYGDATGGQKESEILTQIPLTELKGKVIVMTNFDTRLTLKSAYANIRPSLHEYANFIYKPVVSETQGLGSLSGSKMIRLEDISGSKINWTDSARTVWHVASMDDLTRLPGAAAVDGAVKAGIQSVPVPFYFYDMDKTTPIWNQWNGYAWRLKEPNARYVKPAPVVPAKPSQRLNARVAPNLQPGQALVV